MEADFEIKYREGLSRIGQFNTNHGKIQTPTIMPVLDPLNPNQIAISEIIALGAEMFITNAYLTYKNEQAKQKAILDGIHSLVGYNGPIMTDSGAFQLMGYGNVNITNTEVTEFQEKIHVDLGVYLDIPVSMGGYEETKEALEVTLERAKEHISARKDPTTMWTGPIQGGKYLDLITKSAIEMGALPFNIHAIGSVVPLLESYEYKTVAQMIFTAKKYLPYNRPVHLFGAGHPMIFALAVYLGIDLFDSAAYWLFAKAGRYMTVNGTFHLKDLDYFPCNCKFCLETSPKDIIKAKPQEQTIFLAMHNLAVSFGEIKTIKQAIIDGRLWNLVLQRSSSHPRLTEAVFYLIHDDVQFFIEKFTSLTYKSRLFSHPWANSDPILLRYKDRVLNRFPVTKKIAILINEDTLVQIPKNYQKISINPLFGLIPEEWRTIYPVLQHVSFTKEIDSKTVIFLNEWVVKNKHHFEKLVNLSNISLVGIESTLPENNLESESVSIETNQNDIDIIKALMKYQYNVTDPVLNSLKEFKIEKSKSNRIKEFFINGERFATVRASDNLLIPSEVMAKFIHFNFKFPKHRVVVQSDVKLFIKDGKSVFAKFVIQMDQELRPGDECIIVSNEDELLGFGTLQMTFEEAKSFTRGIMVKTRKGIENS